MIWRTVYHSDVAYCEPLPVFQTTTLTGEPFAWPALSVLLVGRGFDALVEQNVWWKLHAEDFPILQHVYRVFANVSQAERVDVESMISPSHRGRTLIVSGNLEELLDSTHPGKCFAGIASQGEFTMAVRGLPTEDCWEEFSGRLRSELDGSRSR